MREVPGGVEDKLRQRERGQALDLEVEVMMAEGAVFLPAGRLRGRNLPQRALDSCLGCDRVERPQEARKEERAAVLVLVLESAPLMAFENALRVVLSTLVGA